MILVAMTEMTEMTVMTVTTGLMVISIIIDVIMEGMITVEMDTIITAITTSVRVTVMKMLQFLKETRETAFLEMAPWASPLMKLIMMH